ncbi:MAG: GNAT family N-acetyltransferase [bacterium]
MPLESTNRYIIRKAFRADIPKIVFIHKDCVFKINSKFYSLKVIKEWVSTINQQNVLEQFKSTGWVVCEVDKEIVGFAQYSIKDKTLFQIQVSPKFQRKNIGAKLYKYIEEEFLKSGLKIMFLNSTLNAVPFYDRLGFRKVRGIKFELERYSVEMVKMEKTFG